MPSKSSKKIKTKKQSCSSCGWNPKLKLKITKSLKKTKKTNKKNKKKTSKMSYNDIIKSKKISVKKMLQTGGEPCEYLKVQGMQFPDLQIPDQYAKMYNNCDVVSSTPAPGGMHPNMTT